MADKVDLPPVHPGEILREEFLIPMGISITKLAELLAVPPNRISQIVNGKRALTADTAIRLSEAFGTTPQFWLNLQALYDLELVEQREAPSIRKQVSRANTAVETTRRRDGGAG